MTPHSDDNADTPRPANYLSILNGVLTAIIVALMIWVGTQVSTLGLRMQTLEEKNQSLERLRALEMSLARQEILNRISTQIQTLEGAQADIEDFKRWFRQVWPRLRAHGENAEILKRAIEDNHPTEDVELVDPELP